MIRATIILVSISIALGCEKKEPAQPSASNTEATKPEPNVNPTKHKRFLWEFKTEDEVSSSAAIDSDGTVYVGSLDQKLYAINGKTGGKLWEFKTRDIVHSSPTIGSDGTLYVGSFDKNLYAINGISGEKLWDFTTSDSVYCSPVIGLDGILYIESHDGLYAIKTDSKGLAKSPWPMFGQNPQHTGHAPAK